MTHQDTQPPAETLAECPSTDDVRGAIHRLTALAQEESDPPAITKAMIWAYLHGQRDLAQPKGMNGWKNTAPRPSIPMIEAAEREGFLASAAIILWSAMHAAAPQVAVYRTTSGRQTDEGSEVAFSHRSPSGDQRSIAVRQAKQASQIGDADAGEIGECPPVHGEAERVLADHEYKPHVCECGEQFCTGSELTWHQVQRDAEEIQRLRGLLVDPGSPPWEDARAILVAELRKEGLGKQADDVAAAHSVEVPSHIALNLIALTRRAGGDTGAAGWIVSNADTTRWRTWQAGSPAWTEDRQQATRYHRREDAEAVHGEDEDAWRAVPFGASSDDGLLRKSMERIADLSERWTDSLVSQINQIARKALTEMPPADTGHFCRAFREASRGLGRAGTAEWPGGPYMAMGDAAAVYADLMLGGTGRNVIPAGGDAIPANDGEKQWTDGALTTDAGATTTKGASHLSSQVSSPASLPAGCSAPSAETPKPPAAGDAGADNPYVAGPIWAEEEDDCFTAEIQISGGHYVVATVHGATREQVEQRQGAILAALALPAPVVEGERWRHVKRGTVYEVIGRGKLQCAANPLLDDAEIVIYRGEDGNLWARGVGEFHDGRFAALSEGRSHG